MQAAFQAHLSTLYAEDSPLRVSEQSAKGDTAEAGAAVDADKSTMPFDSKLSARELMLRVTGIDISMRREPDLL